MRCEDTISPVSYEPNIEVSAYDEILDEVAFPGQGEYIDIDSGFYLRKIDNNCYIYGLDMLLTKEQLDYLAEIIDSTYSNYSHTRGTVISPQTKYKWPNATIPYKFNSNLSTTHRNRINDAIDVWHNQTQIRLVPRTNQADYVEFIAGIGNSSYVGRIGGRQYITIDAQTGTAGNMIHEIGHAVGMIHEHQNFIRDDHIIVHENNIKSQYRTYFTKETTAQYVFGNWMYDRGYPFSSIMMYPSRNSFGINTTVATMTAKTNIFGNPFINYTDKTFTVQRWYLTASDRAAVAWKYGYNYDPATDPTLTYEMIYGSGGSL